MDSHALQQTARRLIHTALLVALPALAVQSQPLQAAQAVVPVQAPGQGQGQGQAQVPGQVQVRVPAQAQAQGQARAPVRAPVRVLVTPAERERARLVSQGVLRQ